MHFIGTQDGSNVSDRAEEVSEEVASKRAKIEKEDYEAKISAALANVQKSKERNVQLGKKCKILPKDRVFLQKALSEGGKYHKFMAPYEKFPSKLNCYCYLELP